MSVRLVLWPQYFVEIMQGKFKIIRVISKIHGAIYSISKGRLGTRIGRLDVLLLTTVGRKSGRKRNIPLSAVPYGKDYLIVASFGGSPVDPSWLLNIRNNPVVDIRIRSVVKQVKAFIVETVDNRYNEMWTQVVASNKVYESYRKATLRQIPIVVISL